MNIIATLEKEELARLGKTIPLSHRETPSSST
jgi:hypothetical protein